MCRLLGWVSPRSASLSDTLGASSTVAFTALSAYHADGWGVATARAGGTLDLVKAPTCAGLDSRFTQAIQRMTTAGLAHLRWATPGLPVQPDNTHPFTRTTALGPVAFAHNGALHPQGQLARALPLGDGYAPTGTTDSERYFLTVAAALDAGADVATAVARVVERTADLAVTSLNALLLTPDALVVVCLHDPAAGPSKMPVPQEMPVPRLPPGPRRSPERGRQLDLAAPYFELRLRRTAAGVVVASSEFAQPLDQGWVPLPNGSVTVVDRATGDVEVVPLGVGLVTAR